MKKDLFEFSDYKLYLDARITLEAAKTKGYRAQLSNYIQCQQSYLSQVLRGKPDFTLEQAHRLNQFLHHDKVEAKFFILLVEKSRAGTRDLKQFFNEQIEEVRVARFNLKNRLRETEEIDPEAQNKYYSAWYYSAIYVILSIPRFQSISEISKKLHLPADVVGKVISFLDECGLIENVKGKFRVTKKRLYLDRESPFIQRHHINWRSQALQSVELNLPTDLHFSSVVALSVSDFEKIKEIFVKAISEAREVIRPSPEEEIMAITLDVFKL